MRGWALHKWRLGSRIKLRHARPVDVATYARRVEVARPADVWRPVEVARPVEVWRRVEVLRPVDVLRPVEVAM